MDRAQKEEQDSKMYKNKRLNNVRAGWILSFSINSSSSETLLAGTAS